MPIEFIDVSNTSNQPPSPNVSEYDPNCSPLNPLPSDDDDDYETPARPPADDPEIYDE